MRADAAVLSALWDALRAEGPARLLRWWWGEVAGMLPAGWRQVFWGPRSVALRRGPEGWSFASGGGDAGLSVAEGYPGADSHSSGSLERTIQRALADKPFAGRNAWLALDAHELIVRRTSLPFAAEGDLWSALSLDLDRLTPLSSDRAYFGLRVVGRDEATRSLVLDLVAVPRDVVSPRLEELRGLGLRVVGAGTSEECDAPTPLNLLPPDERDSYSAPMALVVTRALAGTAAALAVIAMVLPLWQQREAAIALQPVLEKAKEEASASDKLARDIERLAGDHNFIVAKKHLQPSLAGLVEELSRELPDNTWVQQFEVKPQGKAKEVQLAGETGASSALIAILEKSGTLQNATYKSPLTKGSASNTERFLVAAELKARALPEPMADSSLEPATAAPAKAPAVTQPDASPVAGTPPTSQGVQP